jgi:hypothetical protein
VSLNGDVAVASGKNFSQAGAGTFGTGTGAVSLNGDVTIASGKNFTQSGTGTFSTGTGAVSINGSVTLGAGDSVTATAGAANFDFSAATGTFKTGTGAVTINGSTSIVNGKTLSIGTGTGAPAAIKAIELGTCTEGSGATQFTCGAGQVANITVANLTVTDSITLTGQGALAGACTVQNITAGTSFSIRCTTAPANGTIFNVLIVRK